jgi:hypothetical protein
LRNSGFRHVSPCNWLDAYPVPHPYFGPDTGTDQRSRAALCTGFACGTPWSTPNRASGVKLDAAVCRRRSRRSQFAISTRGELQFTTEAYGLKADGSEFVGETSWGIVDISAGPADVAVYRAKAHGGDRVEMFG